MFQLLLTCTCSVHEATGKTCMEDETHPYWDEEIQYTVHVDQR